MAPPPAMVVRCQSLRCQQVLRVSSHLRLHPGVRLALRCVSTQPAVCCSYARQPLGQARPPLRRARFSTFPSLRRDSLGSHDRPRSREPQAGLTTPVPDAHGNGRTTTAASPPSQSPAFSLLAAYAGWPKRPARPFPPPFFSAPSGSFSDPLSTHNRARARIDGAPMLGVTNGDDAMVATDAFLGVMDGVGAWAQKERGCAALWSRLVAHFWAQRVQQPSSGEPQPVRWLQEAYEATVEALREPNSWLGTTTASAAYLHCTARGEAELYLTQLGDCKVLVLRPPEALAEVEVDGVAEKAVLFATKEQWHYFDCPRQLGTNSPDTPLEHAVLDVVPVRESDLVLAMSDGVTDNLWEHEIALSALKSLKAWQDKGRREDGAEAQGMKFLAQELVLAARQIAEDPFAESPFMEKAVEEGLAIVGGKRDDISVVAARVVKRNKDRG